MEQINNDKHQDKIIDSSKILLDTQQNHENFPKEYIWPKDRHSETAIEVLNEHVIDLQGFFSHDEEATLRAAKLINESCMTHGFFQVINHGIDPELLALADEHGRAFFKLPVDEKLKCEKKDGSMAGFISAHAHRFSEKMPWKQMLSFMHHENGHEEVVVEYFNSTLGTQYKETGLIYQKVCKSVKKLGLDLMELLEISLGVDGHNYYRELFKDCVSIVRCNYYPRCDQPNLTNGVGPHCDPTALTILYQDQIGGLEVFVDNKWKSVQPRRDALVINIGDTFKALSNGKYHSCLHRVMVNSCKPRFSLAFFMCPRGDKQLKPPQDLVEKDGTQKYPAFTWDEFLYFTQNYYRADGNTLEEFAKWLISSKTPNA